MTDKVKVSREVASFIEKYNEYPYDFNQLLIEHTDACVEGYSSDCIKAEAKCLSQYEPIELAEILIKGYEVELTPEEQVEEYYKKLLNSDSKDCKNMALAVRHTLSILKNRIKGVNA